MQTTEKFPLTERTAVFAEELIKFCRQVEPTVISRPIINQLVRAGTSVGANYTEANAASSKKDFRNKIFICKKEAQETRYWLRLAKSVSENVTQIEKLDDECRQLVLIFQKITSTINL